jgi:AmmeMemoRadiSam system protein A
MEPMSDDALTLEERNLLLKLARQALESAVTGERLEPLDLELTSETLRYEGASFVTLTKRGQLRGCIGALEPYQPLVDDVREHAIAAATQDYRFPPVTPGELADISIEISRLTVPKPLDYKDADDLIAKLRPGIDGVVLKHGFRRATFLPQVWEKIPDPVDFLSQLCYKMGAPANSWRTQKMEVLIYQVEEFHE